MLNATKYLDAPRWLVERTLASYEIGPGGCWLYTGKLTHDGYGRVTYRRPAPGRKTENLTVHVLSYLNTHGAVVEGMHIDHVCHNPDACAPPCQHRRCLNPQHLQMVLPLVNLLRGASFSARNAMARTCSEGHPFDGVSKSGERICHRCQAASTARYRARMTPERRAAHLARRRELRARRSIGDTHGDART